MNRNKDYIDKIILKKLKKLREKVQTLEHYKGKPFDPEDSLDSDELMKYQYYIMCEDNERFRRTS